MNAADSATMNAFDLAIEAQRARRLAARRASTIATISSTASECIPFCAAISRTSRSVRSTWVAPAATARATDDGLPSESAAFAYFLNGTWSAAEAPSVLHSADTQS